MGIQRRWRIGFFCCCKLLPFTDLEDTLQSLSPRGVTDMKNDESFLLTETSELLASVSNNPAVTHLQEPRVTSVAASRQWGSSLMFYEQKCGAQWAEQHRKSIFHSVPAVFLFIYFFKSPTSKISYQVVVVKMTNTLVHVCGHWLYSWVLEDILVMEKTARLFIRSNNSTMTQVCNLANCRLILVFWSHFIIENVSAFISSSTNGELQEALLTVPCEWLVIHYLAR